MTQQTDRWRIAVWACVTISTIHATPGGQYAGIYAWLWLVLTLAFMFQPCCICWLRRLRASEPPVWLRLLLIRLSLRRATLGDAFDRMMQRRKEGPR